ncbi:putative SAC3 family protein B-like [Cocos nucifera]|nr:putative SAC3 family protein B-like [Cocos nucifera]
MEEEDVEGLLEYHGFVLKKYEELYVVKEGPFLNGDVDFPTKGAKLVHLKKSKRIIDDVYSEDEQMIELNGEISMGQGILPQIETTKAGASGFSNSKLIVENTAPPTEVGKSLENEASIIILCHKNEVANEKLKLIKMEADNILVEGKQRTNRVPYEFIEFTLLRTTRMIN